MSDKPHISPQRYVGQKFSAVMAATMARLKNVEYIAQDMAAFSAQSKYTTLRGYVFKQEWEKYNAE